MGIFVEPVQIHASLHAPNPPYCAGRSRLSGGFHDPRFAGLHPVAHRCHPLWTHRSVGSGGTGNSGPRLSHIAFSSASSGHRKALPRTGRVSDSIPMPEDPGFVRVTVFVSPFQNLIQLLSHWHTPRCQMTTFLFTGIQCDRLILKIDIIPR